MFGIIVTIFDALFYYPLFNALVFIYNYLPGRDLGLAIIVFTILVKFVLYPFSVKAVKSQRAIQKLQPKIKEIQNLYKDSKEKQGIATLELYKKEDINPFSTLFLVLIQLPILFALYRVSLNILKANELGSLYSFIAKPGIISPLFIGLVDLSHPNIWFAALAAILQFFQTKMLMAKPVTQNKDDMSIMIQKQMTYVSPFITVIFLVKLPAALSLYWIISGIFTIIQQYIILKKHV